MPKLWELAKEGDLAGVEAAIKAGADLEEEGSVRGMINRAHRLLAPPPSFGSVLHPPHHPCLLSLTPPLLIVPLLTVDRMRRHHHSVWHDTASLRL